MSSVKDTLFGSKSKLSYQAPQVMQQSDNEKALENQLMQWNSDTAGDINNLRGYAQNSLANVPQFNFGQMWNDNMGQQNQITNNFAGLAAGQLPEGYEDRTKGYIASGLSDALGSRFSELAGRGIANSSTANSQYGQLQGQAASAFDQNYLNHINSSGNMLNQQQNSLWNGYNQAIDGQTAALQVPTTYYGLMSELMQPTYNMWDTMGNQRYSVSTPGQYVQSGGSQGIFGSLLGAGLSYLGSRKKS